jgi:hypothetical protein
MGKDKKIQKIIVPQPKTVCPTENGLTKAALLFCLETDRKQTLTILGMSFGDASRIATGAVPARPMHHEPVRNLANTMGWRPPVADAI